MSPKTMKLLAKPMLFATAIIWGTSFFIMKNALDIIPVFRLLAVRFTVGGILLAALCGGRWKKFTPDYLWRGAIVGGMLFIAYSVQTFGLSMTTPSKNAFLTAVYCVLVPFFTWAVVRKRPDRYNIAAALLCVAGVGLVSLNDQLSINAGDLITLLTVFQFAFAGLYSWLFSLPTERFDMGLLLQRELLWPMVYLCVMATTVALLFQNVGQRWSDPASASVILSLESVFGVLSSVLFYGDPVTGRLLAGFGLIFVAVLCSETKFGFLRKKPSQHKTCEEGG